MHLPTVKKENRFKRSMIGFGGLNLIQSYSPGEMRDCIGISHKEFPAITQRQKSETVFNCQSPRAVIFAGKECVAADDGLYYDRKKVGELKPGKKQIAALGSKIVVFPDKVYYDTQEEKFADLCGKCETYEATVTFTDTSITLPATHVIQSSVTETSSFPKDSSVLVYSSVDASAEELVLGKCSLKTPSSLQEGEILREKCKRNQYRIVQGVEYNEKTQSYDVDNELVTVKNVLKDIFSEFKDGDIVEISGCVEKTSNNKSATITSKSDTTLNFSAEDFTPCTETANITIQRKIPDFTCICSYENRLWGCEGNTLYGSALGDVTNFFIYKNLSTDSFTVTSNSAGDFTACVSYGNCCLFFKENSCYKLYGNRPSNFQLNESYSSGIAEGESMSVVSALGKVIYKGVGGIYAFYGGIPERISDKLGNITMKNTVGGSDGKYYYISADTTDGRQEFVWDIERNLWSKSGVTDVLGYFCYRGDMYRLKNEGIEKILDEADDEAQWSITLCPFDEGYYNTKNYSRVHICAQLFKGAHISVEMKSDGGIWQTLNHFYGDEKKYINIPCVLKSCHEVQIRISGKGKSIIESIVREFSVN